jgi:hypothetical protein
MEKSSKNYISLFGGKPTGGLPMPPPTPPRREIAHLTRGKCASAMRGRDFYSRDLLAEEGGGGWKKCETVPFDNGSTYQLQTQNQDSQYHSAPLEFTFDLRTLPATQMWLRMPCLARRRKKARNPPSPFLNPSQPSPIRYRPHSMPAKPPKSQSQQTSAQPTAIPSRPSGD